MNRMFEQNVAKAPTDGEWLDRLNEANDNVNSLSLERDYVQKEHRRATARFQRSDKIMRQITKKHPANIERCSPYFDLRLAKSEFHNSDKHT